MAELGHPVIGPQSMSKLTQAEIRIYAEGLEYQNEQEEAAQSDGSGVSDRESKRQRQHETFERMDRQARENGGSS